MDRRGRFSGRVIVDYKPNLLSISQVDQRAEGEAWMQADLTRFDSLLTALEGELGTCANLEQLESNALVAELVRFIIFNSFFHCGYISFALQNTTCISLN
jgi:hypothetical protein